MQLTDKASKAELQLAPTRVPMGAAAAGAHARPQPARRGARLRPVSLTCAPASAEGAPATKARGHREEEGERQRRRVMRGARARDARSEAARGVLRLRVTGSGWRLGTWEWSEGGE